MSLEFMDGFDHYTSSANLAAKWDTTSNGGTFSPGRFGGNASQLWNGPVISLSQGQLASLATRTVGFAMYPSNGFSGSNAVIMAFLDGSSTQIDLRAATAGPANSALVITRNGTVLATSTQTITASVWVYVELQVTIGSTTGAYTLRVTTGGVLSTWLTATGVNTQASSNATTNGIKFFAFAANVNGGIDDFYVLNSSGSVNNTFLGECRIFTTLPNADTGATSTNFQWTPSSGTTHYNLVNESNPDSDTTYVSSATAGQLDTYKYQAIAPTGNIVGVQAVLCQRKDDVGGRTTCVEYRSAAGTNYAGANNFSPGSGYLMNRQIYETDPATGLAWTVANINAAEFGINCIA